jgi:hypothetical protein
MTRLNNGSPELAAIRSCACRAQLEVGVKEAQASSEILCGGYQLVGKQFLGGDSSTFARWDIGSSSMNMIHVWGVGNRLPKHALQGLVTGLVINLSCPTSCNSRLLGVSTLRRLRNEDRLTACSSSAGPLRASPTTRSAPSPLRNASWPRSAHHAPVAQRPRAAPGLISAIRKGVHRAVPSKLSGARLSLGPLSGTGPASGALPVEAHRRRSFGHCPMATIVRLSTTPSTR